MVSVDRFVWLVIGGVKDTGKLWLTHATRTASLGYG